MTRSSFNRMIVESAASIWGRPIPRRRLFAHWHRLRGGISLSLSLYRVYVYMFLCVCVYLFNLSELRGRI